LGVEIADCEDGVSVLLQNFGILLWYAVSIFMAEVQIFNPEYGSGIFQRNAWIRLHVHTLQLRCAQSKLQHFQSLFVFLFLRVFIILEMVKNGVAAIK
jgi:hypothetical protein